MKAEMPDSTADAQRTRHGIFHIYIWRMVGPGATAAAAAHLSYELIKHVLQMRCRIVIMYA